MILDHLIATVPDLRTTHAKLLSQGFAEAWPPGPFWPAAMTSGIALGGASLELVQPDAGTSEARIETLVFAPVSLDEGRQALSNLGIAFEERVKIEPNPHLLALRGFPPEMAATPQTICTNLYPQAPSYPFFLCVYAPFLKARLASSRFVAPRGPLSRLELRAKDPELVQRSFSSHVGALQLDLRPGTPQVDSIRFENGSLLTAADL